MVRLQLILICLICFPSVFSQVIEQDNFFWIHGGVGGFKEQKIEELGGVTINLGFNYLNRRIIERHNSVRKANDLFDLRLAGYFNDGDEHSTAAYFDLGILYGKTAGDVLMLFACAGIGVIGGIYSTIEFISYPSGPGGVIPATVEHSFIELNVPIEAGININSPVIGIGVTGFANINKTQPMTGLHLILQVGRITKFPKNMQVLNF